MGNIFVLQQVPDIFYVRGRRQRPLDLVLGDHATSMHYLSKYVQLINEGKRQS